VCCVFVRCVYACECERGPWTRAVLDTHAAQGQCFGQKQTHWIFNYICAYDCAQLGHHLGSRASTHSILLSLLLL